MRAATVVQVLQDLFKFYCMFYFTCDRSLNKVTEAGSRFSVVGALTFDSKACVVLQVNELGGVAGGSGGQLLSPGGGYLSSTYELATSDIMTDIQNQLHELSLTDSDNSQSNRFRATKKPPSTYLCHLCFQKGHFIKDCPQVLN